MGLGGEHLIPPKHAWQSWRSVTNPAAPNTPAPASVNTLLGWDCFRNGINKEVAAQPEHQVTLGSQTARALPCSSFSRHTKGTELGSSCTIQTTADTKGAAVGPEISSPLEKAMLEKVRVFSDPLDGCCTVPWGETLMGEHPKGMSCSKGTLLRSRLAAGDLCVHYLTTQLSCSSHPSRTSLRNKRSLGSPRFCVWVFWEDSCSFQNNN